MTASSSIDSRPGRCSRLTTRSIRRPERSSSKLHFQTTTARCFQINSSTRSCWSNTIHDATLIPAAALQRSQQGSFVYVVKPDHTVEMRSVKIIATQGELVAIDTGLRAGELVAIDGLDKLQQGSRVNVQMA